MKNEINENFYKILLQLYNCQIKLQDGTSYIIISQADISRILGISTITVNKYFKQFQNDNLILPSGKYQGKYFFTEKGINIICKLKELKEIIH